MLTVKIKGTLNEAGQIDLELPANWRAGEIIIEIPILRDKELETLLQPNPQPVDDWQDFNVFNFAQKTLGEIDKALIGAGSDWEIGDSAVWLDDQRQKRAEKSRHQWTD